MKVKITEPKPWQRIVEIEVPAEVVQDKLHSAYQEYQRKAVLPGFRKGKVPISLLKARYASSVEKSVLQDLIPQTWQEVRQENKIDPVAEPVINEVDFEPGKPLKFKATVEVRPEIELGHYTGLNVTTKEVTVSQEDVDQSLRALQERHATIETSKEQAGQTDIVLVDTWKVDPNGIPIVGQQSTDIPIDLSAPNIIDEYRQALVGTSLGDQKRITVTYPPDHPSQELAGKKVSYLLKVKEIKKKTLPALDDEFAKSVSDYDTVTSLEEGLRQSIQRQREQQAKRDMEEHIIDQIIERNSFEVPESMVAGYIETLIGDLHPGEKKDGELDQLRQSYRPFAVRAVKRWFILEQIRKQENIEVSDQELDARVAAMAEARHLDPKELSAHLVRSDQMDKLRREIQEEKTFHFLLGKATVTTSPAREIR